MKVIGFLKKEGGQKEEQLVSLQEELQEEKEKSIRDKIAMESQLQTTSSDLEGQLQERNEEVLIILLISLSLSHHLCLPGQLAVMQGELKTVRDFRKQRVELEAELKQLKQSLSDSEQENFRTLQTVEQKFFEEKVSSFSFHSNIISRESTGKITERGQSQDCRIVRESTH